MTTSQFISIKKNSKTPQFKDLVGLTPLNNTSDLLDFMVMLHPNQCKIGQGNKGEVFTAKDHYSFSMYTTGILRTTTESGKRVFYSFK